MAKTFVQEIVFENTTPKAVYDLYMDADQHSMIAGTPASIKNEEGTEYSVHGGYIRGKNLQLAPNKLIVQSWRAQGWKDSDVDSTFTISLEPKGNDVVLLATHANVPDEHADSLAKGWHDHYWSPWKQHLAGEPITRPQM